MQALALLPLCLFAGVAVQGIGFYLLGFILPLFFWKRTMEPQISSRDLVRIALWFLIAYYIFSFSSIFNYLFLDRPEFSSVVSVPENFKMKKLFNSRFSSGFMGMGVSLLVCAYVRRFLTGGFTGAMNVDARQIFKWFTAGMLVASFCAFIYASIQHFTGYDFKLENQLMPETNLMSDGRYRSYAFFGHPLSLGAGALAVFSFYYYFAWQNLVKKFIDVRWTVVSFTIALFSGLMVIMSGGRLAILLLLVAFLFVPLTTKMRGHWNRFKWGGCFVGLAGLVAFIFYTGVLKRFSELDGDFTAASLLGDRLIFWKVHWQMFLDRPVIGQGYALVSQFVRDDYYNALGFGSMANKYNAHNLFLEVLALAGIAGAVVVSVSILFIHKHLKRLSQVNGICVSLYAAFIFSLWPNLIHGLTQNTFFDSNVSYVYLGLLALVIWSLNVSTGSVEKVEL